MELFLIRHAQSANNARPEAERVEDPELTDLGLRQAERLAAWIPSLELTRLVTSPFRRTLLTTQPIQQATGLTPQVRVDLHERGGCYRGHIRGKEEGRPGMSRAEIRREFGDHIFDDPIDDVGWWGSKPYESFHHANHRASRLLRRTIDEFSGTGERVAYVMHADFKCLFIGAFHRQGLSEVPRNTSVTRVILEEGTATLADFNRIDHLNEELISW